jgi:hypothetical protein
MNAQENGHWFETSAAREIGKGDKQRREGIARRSEVIRY